jgi:tetratricopeptide (TPR) repeat protein
MLLQVPQADVYARAETLLDAGDLKAARGVLEDHLSDNRNDPEALILLGRVFFQWPVVGRWRALELLREASHLQPDDPAPFYWKMRIGKFLGSADGEALMRSGIIGVLERDPRYRDVWSYWPEIFRNDGFLESVAELLAAHGDDPGVLLRRAQLLTEARAYDRAAAVLVALEATGWQDAGLWALRAQGALEQGDTLRGLAWYDRALGMADADSMEVLWHQVAPIAWPDEDSTYTALAPEGREAFLRAFWAKREPDLLTSPNERIAEHFTRLRYARDKYRLLHPQARFHYSAERRTLVGSEAARVLRAVQFEFGLPWGGLMPGRSRFEDDIQRAGLGVDVRDLPEPDSVTRYRKYGFDGRGLIYLRFGKPERQLVSHRYDVEAWDFGAGQGGARVVFARASSGGGGDMIVYPTNRLELHNSTLMLERDASSLTPTMDLYAWVAFFRGSEPGRQLVYVGVDADNSATAAWDSDWREVQRVTGRGPHTMSLPDGPHVLGIDAVEGTDRGRVRADIDVPHLWRGRLALSSLLLASSADTGLGREEIARRMPGDKVFPAGTPLALYAEIYGLSRDRAGTSRYQVQYTFESEHGAEPISLWFDRVVRSDPVIRERITLQPEQIGPGRYRLRLTVVDRVRRLVTDSTVVPFELR